MGGQECRARTRELTQDKTLRSDRKLQSGEKQDESCIWESMWGCTGKTGGRKVQSTGEGGVQSAAERCKGLNLREAKGIGPSALSLPNES